MGRRIFRFNVEGGLKMKLARLAVAREFCFQANLHKLRGSRVLVRELRHPPAKVWQALTDPKELREWAPFDADRSLATVGAVKLSTVGTPQPHVSESRVIRAEAPRLLKPGGLFLNHGIAREISPEHWDEICREYFLSESKGGTP